MYTIVITEYAIRQLKKVNRQMVGKLRESIAALSTDPRPYNHVKLTNKVTCLWNTGEVRQVDFQLYITESKPQSPIARLIDKRLLSEVKTDGRTLYWDNLLTIIDYDGSQHPAHSTSTQM